MNNQQALFNRVYRFVEQNHQLFFVDLLLEPSDFVWDGKKSYSQSCNIYFCYQVTKSVTVSRCSCGQVFWGENESRSAVNGHCEARSMRMHAAKWCLSSAEILKNADAEIFKDLLLYHRTTKRPLKGFLEKYGGTQSVVSIHQKKEPQTGHDQSFVDDFLVFSKVVASPSQFPSLPGCYLVRFLNNGKWESLYAGKTQDLFSRWIQHHRYPEVNLLQSIGLTLEFRYLVESSVFSFAFPLEKIESLLIQSFKPRLNNTRTLHRERVDSGFYKSEKSHPICR